MNYYGLEIFHQACDSLNSPTDDLRKALEDAYCYHIIHVQDDAVPSECVSALQEIRNGLSLPKNSQTIEGHSGCKLRIEHMDDSEVERYIELIHNTYNRIKELCA